MEVPPVVVVARPRAFACRPSGPGEIDSYSYGRLVPETVTAITRGRRWSALRCQSHIAQSGADHALESWRTKQQSGGPPRRRRALHRGAGGWARGPSSSSLSSASSSSATCSSSSATRAWVPARRPRPVPRRRRRRRKSGWWISCRSCWTTRRTCGGRSCRSTAHSTGPPGWCSSVTRSSRPAGWASRRPGRSTAPGTRRSTSTSASIRSCSSASARPETSRRPTCWPTRSAITCRTCSGTEAEVRRVAEQPAGPGQRALGPPRAAGGLLRRDLGPQHRAAGPARAGRRGGRARGRGGGG